MKALGQPISRREAISLPIVIAVLFALQRWPGGLGPVTWLLLYVAVLFVVQPVSTLIHELGHAVAVALVARRPSRVVVGRGPWMTIRLEPVTISFSLLPMRGVVTRGFCRYDPVGLPWRSLAWIALAGPIATLLELLSVLAAAPVLWSAGALARKVTVLTAAALVASLLANLRVRPLPPNGDAARVSIPDGMRARLALANHRAGTAPPTRMPAPAATGAADVAPGILPAHWGPADPEQRRELDHQLRLAIGPPEPGQDPGERKRIVAQLRAALSAPAQPAPHGGGPEEQRDRARAATTIPPPSGQPAA